MFWLCCFAGQASLAVSLAQLSVHRSSRLVPSTLDTCLQVLHRLVHTIEGLLKGYPEESQLAEKVGP